MLMLLSSRRRNELPNARSLNHVASRYKQSSCKESLNASGFHPVRFLQELINLGSVHPDCILAARKGCVDCGLANTINMLQPVK